MPQKTFSASIERGDLMPKFLNIVNHFFTPSPFFRRVPKSPRNLKRNSTKMDKSLFTN